MIGYFLPIGFLSILGVFIYTSTLNKEVVTEKIKRSQNTIINIATIANSVSRMVQAVRGRILFPQDINYTKNYEEGIELFRNTATKLDKLMDDPQEKQQLAVMVTEINRIDEISRRVFNLVDKGDISYATILTASLRIAEVEKTQNEIIRKQEQILAITARQEENETRWLLALIVFGTVLVVIGSLTIGISLASDIGRMMNQAAEAIGSSSTEIAATLEQQERTASQQAEAVNQTSITMDELGASSRQSAEQAELAASGASQVRVLSKEGSQTVDRTLAGMTTLKEKVEAIAHKIKKLSGQTQQIGNISGLVSELANQTNMLALNAAVEAARAGQHGKGFAVIATEIRQLADRSKQSATQINNLVTDIQTAINSTVTVTNEGTQTVEEGMQLTQGTAEAFSGVVDAINSIVISSQQISLNAQQQAIAVTQVVDAMKSLNLGAAQTAEGISQTKVGTQKLQEAAQRLKDYL